MKIRFAVSPGSGVADPGQLASFVSGAEERGFDSLWFPDLPLLDAVDPLLAVSFAASVSKTCKLGVDLVPFGREPFVFARQVAQLDRLTGGRLLVTLVPGVDLPGERAALGIEGRHRGRLLDALIPQLRAWWSGAQVEGLALPVMPCQEPLEIWLGGFGPQAVERAGRLADGWLGSGAQLSPQQVEDVCRRIQDEAAMAARKIDPEHFGLSIGYARAAEDLDAPSRPIRQPPPVGADALRAMIEDLIERGVSKFVFRRTTSVVSWADELDWLAKAVLDLQT